MTKINQNRKKSIKNNKKWLILTELPKIRFQHILMENLQIEH